MLKKEEEEEEVLCSRSGGHRVDFVHLVWLLWFSCLIKLLNSSNYFYTTYQRWYQSSCSCLEPTLKQML